VSSLSEIFLELDVSYRSVMSRLEQVIYEVGFHVAGPLLTAYSVWCIAKARLHGANALHFLARDGDILRDITTALGGCATCPIQIRYVYASRLAWNQPLWPQRSKDSNYWVFADTDSLTITSFCDRLGLKPEDIRPYLERLGFPPGSWDANIPRRLRGRLECIMADPAIRSHARKSLQVRRTLLDRYLRQQFYRVNPIVICDLGWYGSLQETLEDRFLVLGKRVVGLYFGLKCGDINSRTSRSCFVDITREIHRPGSIHEVFLFDVERNTGDLDSSRWVITPLEMFCSGLEGTLCEFQVLEKDVLPVLSCAENTPAIEWGLRTFRKGVIDFAQAFAAKGFGRLSEQAFKEISVDMLRRFWYSPTAEEAQVFGSFPWEDGFGRFPIYIRIGQSSCLSRRAVWPTGISRNQSESSGE
jgi:hypothetical protein